MPKKFIKYVDPDHEGFIQKNKDTFLGVLRATVTSRDIEPLIAYLESTSFFTDPASARYHSSFDGGLCDHSLRVYKMLKMKAASLGSDVDPETLVIVALLHDICKVGSYGNAGRFVKNENDNWDTVPSYTYNENNFPAGHGTKSALIIMRYFKLNIIEQLAIVNHMGPTASDYDFSAASKLSSLSVMLYTADMEAAFIFETQEPEPERISYPKGYKIMVDGDVVGYAE